MNRRDTVSEQREKKRNAQARWQTEIISLIAFEDKNDHLLPRGRDGGLCPTQSVGSPNFKFLQT